jgi:hypothetical protein
MSNRRTAGKMVATPIGSDDVSLGEIGERSRTTRLTAAEIPRKSAVDTNFARANPFDELSFWHIQQPRQMFFSLAVVRVRFG